MPVVDRFGLVLEQLLENQDVHGELRRAATRGRQAFGGAKRKKSKKQALADERVRLRVRQTLAALRNAVDAGRRGREAELKKAAARRRRGRILLVGATAGAAAVAFDRGMRERILGALDKINGSAEQSAPDGVRPQTSEPHHAAAPPVSPDEVAGVDR